MRTMRKIAIALLVLGAVLGSAAPAAALPGPAWKLSLLAAPTNFAPGATHEFGIPDYTLVATNVGGGPTSGPIKVTDTLPSGLNPVGASLQSESELFKNYSSCTVVGQTVSCTYPEACPIPTEPERKCPVQPGQWVFFEVDVDVGAGLVEGSSLANTATISGGGAPAASAESETPISSLPAGFGFLPGESGLSAALTEADGQPTSQAGSHPGRLTVDLNFPIVPTGDTITAADALNGAGGGPRDAHVFLPRGLVVDPSATPVKCTEAELEAENGGCPDASAVGTVDVMTTILGGAQPQTSPLYNMDAPFGSAANLGFNALGIGVYVHIEGGVHAGDYALAATSNDILAVAGHPLVGFQAQLWGDPSAPSHDYVRGRCVFSSAICPVVKRDVPLLSAPTSCADRLEISGAVDSWTEPGVFHEQSAPLQDANRNPTEIAGCSALHFSPTLTARPTTSVADSPSGLSFDLHVPQTDSLNELATAHLRKAVVTLPEGLVLNPASANGLVSCSPAQIGIDPGTGVANGAEPSCPDPSKVGSVEVDSPLVENPLVGSVYVAKPYDNPFDSLLAIYLTIDDPQTGVLVKLAGHVVSDPNTGRLVTTFDENPQLPFSDFKVNFFGGAGGVLRTPATCGNYSTASQLTPWSYPDSGPPATPHDDYAISQGPGGSCATNENALPNSPSFDSGAASAIAARHTPFVLHLRRNDGTQNFSAVNVSPPPGLTAKLAGTAQCPDTALAAAAQKSGREEQQNPSCPASSEVGSFVAGAGAGPAPYYTPGKVYLSGPYKGAPLSLAFITPAAAGPYDLGTVVTKAAVYLNASTGRVTTVSDPLPRILQGIVLDVRSVDVSLDRPDFTRNGTSCDPLSIDGSLSSTLGQVAPLSQRFQLAECTRLAFKPKLGIRLFGGTRRGGHPALRGVLSMPEGGANIAKASVALPHSEFLDQAHIGTVCTRVQFAEGDGNGSNCPAASIYGHATATSPLVDYTLEGNAYLRSSSHELPDLVVALHGPPSQPIQVDAVGRVDSVKGGIRTTFEGVPDLPVSSFVLNMQGGKKGLLQNSTNICKATNKATALFDAQNGDTADLSPALKNGKCGKARHHHHGKHRRHGRAAPRHRATR